MSRHAERAGEGPIPIYRATQVVDDDLSVRRKIESGEYFRTVFGK